MIFLFNILRNQIFIGLLLIPIISFTQEYTLKETPEQKQHKKELQEEQDNLNFQNFFFDALQQRARNDYNKAIEVLERCKNIYPDDEGMNFEFAKNYLLLKDYDNAIYFDEKVLEKKPKNIHVLEHLKKTYRLQHDYDNAIIVQEKIIVLNPKKEADLIYLYIGNRQKDKARKLYLKVEKMALLNDRKAYYKKVLFPNENNQQKPIEKTEVVTTQINSVETLREQFKKNKSYTTLKKLLSEENKLSQFDLLVKDSKDGLELFPAQAFVYFMNGKALNHTKKYNSALEVLEAGLDFIIDNNNLQADFFEQMKKSYLGLGKNKDATKYGNKALSLRNKNQ